MFDVLAVVPVGHQQGVGGVDDDEVVDTDYTHHAVGALNKAAGGFVHEGLALDAVALLVGLGQFAHRSPGADVAPADLAGHHGDGLGFFHDGVVDGVVGHLGEAGGVQFHLWPRFAVHSLGLAQTGLGGFENGRAVQRHFAQDGARREAEHAGIPVIAALGQVLAGGFEVGFFNKALDVVTLGLDVAKAGFGSFGVDAEGDDAPLLGERLRLRHSGSKGGLVGDEVVGGQNEQDGVVTVRALHLQRCCSHGGGGVAAKGLQHEWGGGGAGWAAAFACAFGGDALVFL